MRCLLPLLFIIVAPLVFAAESTPAYRVIPGAIIFEEHFAQAALPAGCAIAKGTWQIIAGVLDGSEKAADNHPGVCAIKVALPKAFIVTARVRFEGATVTTLVFNGAGHICRISVTPKGFTVTGEKDKKNESDKSVTVGRVTQDFVRGQWYNFTIEIAGDEVLVYTDPKHVAYGKDAKVGRPKTALNLTVGKSSVRYDDLTIRAAESNPDWPARKASLGLR